VVQLFAGQERIMRWQFTGLSNPGRVRNQNEDAFSLRLAERGVFIVADGLGGHQGGQVASRLVVESLETSLGKSLDMRKDLEADHWPMRLQAAFLEANQTVFDCARQNPALAGMGCTLLVACLSGQGLLIGHVGDVRGYLWRNCQLLPLTRDHSEVQQLVARGYLTEMEARYHPFRHRVERAVGLFPQLEVETRTHPIQESDRLLFCTDGVWNMLEDARLRSLLARESGLEECARRLETEANAAGGEDNLTLILVDLFA
jgi:protein phosphatase